MGGAPLKPGDVATQKVHEDRFGDVVGVVAGGDDVALEQSGAPVQGLAPEDAAEGAVVFPAHLGHDVVHGPTVEVLVGEHRQGQVVLELVPPDRLEAVVPVT